MSTIAELEVPAAEFALADSFAALPDLEVEVERVVAHDSDRLLPFAWVRADAATATAVADALESDPSVAEARELADVGDERLYEMRWETATELLRHVVHEQGATVRSALGRDGRWSLHTLFPERQGLSATREFCASADLTLDVRRVYELDTRRRGRFGLTRNQHDSLVRAARMGYYDVPRDATLSEVASGLGISHQALSERLRRGHGHLVRGALTVGADGNER
ncbi:bacterio-opsin activator domain-containing protein [Halobium salinum]|uniref:Bacterio-opsin activator domain-containing protein n=1 Tax=Halobium salinum TaxID=1364940 RepID=A0ABD5PD44_9EURY|nr:bacterio-opsin activator domain-containing protein [Halobium salinum]